MGWIPQSDLYIDLSMGDFKNEENHFEEAYFQAKPWEEKGPAVTFQSQVRTI